MTYKPARPFLITKDDSGAFRLTLRDTRYNSQDYPFVVCDLLEKTFGSLAEAKSFAKTTYDARPQEIAVE